MQKIPPYKHCKDTAHSSCPMRQRDGKFHALTLYSQGGPLLPPMHEPRDRTNLIYMPAATESKVYSTTSTLTEAQSMIFIYCLSMSSLDVLLRLHSHYNCSLDINRIGFCCSQVIWVDRKGDSKQQWRNPKWKGRNNNHLLQWLESVMSWLATVHHYCFLVSGIRSRAMCQGLHTVSC